MLTHKELKTRALERAEVKAEYDQLDEEFCLLDEFLKARKKGVAWDDRMQKAKDEEAKRKAEIEQKFLKAKDDKDAGPPDDLVMKSPLDWD